MKFTENRAEREFAALLADRDCLRNALCASEQAD